MKNWVISENKNIVYKVGEFIIQVTTIEYLLGEIYDQYVESKKEKEKFLEMMFGGKIKELSKKIKLGEIQKKIKSVKDWKENRQKVNLKTRLEIVKIFRNKIAHNALDYNPVNKQVYIKSENIDNELDDQLYHTGELLTDLYIMLLCIKDPHYKNYKEVIRN